MPPVFPMLIDLQAVALRRESRTSTISSSRKHRRVAFDEEEILKVLNEYRSQHGSGPLQWSNSCARRAQGKADHSAGQTTEYGENLARSTNARWEDANVACIAAIHHWQVRFSCPSSSPYCLSDVVIDERITRWGICCHVHHSKHRVASVKNFILDSL